MAGKGWVQPLVGELGFYKLCVAEWRVEMGVRKQREGERDSILTGNIKLSIL